jgi:hypothetical protein
VLFPPTPVVSILTASNPMQPLSKLFTFTLVCLASAILPAADLKPLFSDDFEHGANHWQPGDANAWKIVETPQGKAFSLFQQSKYEPKHRSPINIALVKDLFVSDFVLTTKVQSTVKDYGHRDMCLYFGYQDPAHFYYVHFGKQTDDHANQIFIVNDAPRTKISTKTTPGTPWTDNWHTLRVERKIDDGSIKVYFDDLKNPAMTASDKTFIWGQVGIGSFDDIGNFDDFQVEGVKVDRK